jgi:hypothetical protein
MLAFGPGTVFVARRTSWVPSNMNADIDPPSV